ncbi:MAG TPA: acylphosphatase [Candidatus Babeliales bacterium]|jgi:acylphosphatase|nr:acylphosphatase [Candidatus Babeliales bacterium]
MNKCVKISFNTEYPENFLRDFVQKHAHELGLEGLAQVSLPEQRTIVMVCGPKEQVDSFVDIIHRGTKQVQLKAVEIEPFLKVKDYRGVFRVID